MEDNHDKNNDTVGRDTEVVPEAPSVQKPKLPKWVIAALSVMGVAVIGLTVALIVTNSNNAVPVSNDNSIVADNSSSSVTDTLSSEADIESVPTEVTDTASGAEPQPEPQEQPSQPQEQPSEPQDNTSQTTSSDENEQPVSTTAQSSSVSEQTKPQEQTKPVTTTAKPSAPEPVEADMLLEYSIDNSWESTGELMYGIQFGITNNSGSGISGWELVMEIDGLSSCQGWNGTYTTNGNVLTISNAEYNGDISNGGTIVVGCNLGTTKSFRVKSAKVNGISCVIKEGYVNQNDQNNQNNQNNNNGQQNNNGNQNNNQNPNTPADVSELLQRSEDAVQGDDWLFTDGNRIVDKNGKRVWLTGVNWFGYNTGTNTFDGLWNSQLEPSVKAIADHGFNLIRVPISAELINQWAAGEYPKANYNNAYNTALNDMNSLQIFEYFLKLAEENGIKVMPDIHSAETNASGHNVNLWYTSKVSVEDFYSALEWMADRYKNNDTIIAYDLKNEPHGKPYEGDAAAIWNDSTDANNWKYVAETAAARILAKNPNVLILVEGTEIYPIDLASNSDYHSTNEKDYYFNWWGGNLRAVKDYPINLGKYQNKLVYSPHDYGPTVYKQPWFEGSYNFDTLMRDCWYDNWFYIHEGNTAPLLIGEWGGFMREPNLTWMTYMRKLIKDNKLNHTFWCFNANSGDTGGLVLDDFKTWDEEKYAFVKEVLWQENGKFVGLDHAIPLGDNGITLSKAKGI